MRISSNTRQYINAIINEKAAAKHTALKEKFETLRGQHKEALEKVKDAFESEKNKVIAEAVKKITAVMKKYGVAFYTTYNGTIYKPSVNINYADVDELSAFKTKIDAAKKSLNDFNNKVVNTQREILAKLELGGTMKDLEKMLAEVRF